MGIILGNKITNLPILERPREKAVRYGFDSLSDAEVLAIIISSGTKEYSALDLSNMVLSEFSGLYNTVNKNYEDFLTFKGIKNATACKLSAIFEIAKRYNAYRLEFNEDNSSIDSKYLYQKYIHKIADYDQEVLIVIVLDKKKRIVHERTLFKGSNQEITFSIRDILKMVVSHNGYYFYVIHNHPSDNPHPSKQDIDFTRELVMDSDKLGIQLADHIIITRRGYFSFLDMDVKEETNRKKC